jgi:translation initiation factor IF-3
MNEDIRVREVRLIDATGQNVGVVLTTDALAKAVEAGLDLVEISPDANPPVAKILDYGKYKYQEQKKAAEARKKQKVVEVKELKYRPMIDDHDYDVKMRAMARFFEEGDKVKITLRFRGREITHPETAQRQLDGHRHLLVERHAGEGDAVAPADLDAAAIGGVVKRLGGVEVTVPKLMLAGLDGELVAVELTAAAMSVSMSPNGGWSRFPYVDSEM